MTGLQLPIKKQKVSLLISDDTDDFFTDLDIFRQIKNNDHAKNIFAKLI